MLVGVYGPREVPSRKETLGKGTIECMIRPRSGMPSSRDREWERMLGGILEQCVLSALHPRSLISVVVQVLSDDGSVHVFFFSLSLSMFSHLDTLTHMCTLL